MKPIHNCFQRFCKRLARYNDGRVAHNVEDNNDDDDDDDT